MRRLFLLLTVSLVALTIGAKVSGSEFVPGKIYYLYNVGAGKYYCAGNSWGTQASVGDEPLQVRLEYYEYAFDKNTFTLSNFFRNSWMYLFFSDSQSLFVDRASQLNYGFSVKKVGDCYRIQASANTEVNPDFNATAFPDKYVGLDVSEYEDNTALSSFLTEGDGHYIDWLFVAVEDYEYQAHNINAVGDMLEIANPEFDESYYLEGWEHPEGWTYRDGTYFDNNYGTGSDRKFTISQTVRDLPNGLYRIKACALDWLDKYDRYTAIQAYDPSVNLHSYLFANGYQTRIKGLNDDRLETNIYLRNNLGFLTCPDGKVVTNGDVNSACLTFANNLYENCVIGVVADGRLTFGVTHDDPSRDTYVSFDKFEVTYLSPSTDIASYASTLLGSKMSAQARASLESSMNALASAKGTDKEAAALADFYNSLGKAATSVRTYEQVGQYLTTFQEALSNKKSNWAKTLEEANTAYNACVSGYNDESLTDNEAVNAVVIMKRLAERLAYKHLDIAVTTPGALGDSILSKVENFSDVQSLRLTGKLNDDDIATLRNRLVNLLELDMAGLDWKAIPDEQFRDKTNLERVVLPGNVQSIGNSAFYNCQKLQTVEFPSSLRTIGSYAFYRTYGFSNAVLPEGFYSLGEWAFHESGLASVTFPSSLGYVGNYSFYNCDGLKEIHFNGQTRIGYAAFHDCDALSNLSFPTTLTIIDNDAFSYCGSLKEIAFNEGLTSIGENSFYDCDALQSITLPSSLLTLNGYYAFRECNNLTQVTCLAIVPPYTDNGNIVGWGGRDLYVPELSVNVYKQTAGWDEFNIHGVKSMPANIVIQSDYKLNWPDSLNINYKPNVTITDRGNSQYGSLTVNGNSTLSAGLFTMKYDPNVAYYHGYYDQWDVWTHNRFPYTSLVNNAHVRADNITFELWLHANAWEFVSFPFDVKVGDIRLVFEGTPFVVRKYDGQKRAEGLTGETWVNMTADSILHAGQGYIWRSASTDANRDHTGFYLDALQTVNKNNVFTSQDVEVPLSYYESEFAHNRSWNFIGNPYPCYYDIRAMQTSAPIIVWENSQSNYRAFSPQDDSYILNPGQAFFVQRPVDEESITFLKEGRQINLTVRDVTYGNSSRANSPQAQRCVFNLIITGNDRSDRTRFVISDAAAMSYEQGRDATKFTSLDPNAIQLYTIGEGVHFAINERPLEEGVVALGVKLAADGLYTLKLDTKVQNEVWLTDHLTGTQLRIDGNEEGYTFNSEAGTFENRFTVRLGQGDVTGIVDVNNGKEKRTSVVYDLQGRSVEAGSVSARPGIYVKDGRKAVVK